MIPQIIRTTFAYFLCPLMKGRRFSKMHRKTDTLVYRCIDTVLANQLADTLHRQWAIDE